MLVASLTAWRWRTGDETHCKSMEEPRGFGKILPDDYRRQLYFNYEKRIRKNSAPDKVYAYFASVACEDGSHRMTFADLARSVLPVFQPTGSIGIKSGALPGEPIAGIPWCDASELIQTFDLDEDGLVSYPEYLVFLALYRMQRKECESFFRRFDADGDGKLSRDEFERMIENIMATEKLDKKGYGLRTGMKGKDNEEPPQTALTKYVYQEQEDPSGISLEQFKLFLQSLHDDIVWAEFSHYDVERNGWICGQDFAKAMIAGADVTSISKYLQRVREMPRQWLETRVNFEQFYSFRVLQEKLGESEQSSERAREHARWRTCPTTSSTSSSASSMRTGTASSARRSSSTCSPRSRPSAGGNPGPAPAKATGVRHRTPPHEPSQAPTQAFPLVAALCTHRHPHCTDGTAVFQPFLHGHRFRLLGLERVRRRHVDLDPDEELHLPIRVAYGRDVQGVPERGPILSVVEQTHGHRLFPLDGIGDLLHVLPARALPLQKPAVPAQHLPLRISAHGAELLARMHDGHVFRLGIHEHEGLLHGHEREQEGRPELARFLLHVFSLRSQLLQSSGDLYYGVSLAECPFLFHQVFCPLRCLHFRLDAHEARGQLPALSEDRCDVQQVPERASVLPVVQQPHLAGSLFVQGAS
eukprot:scaffold631_cov318-Pavlova_lutheri.AAC.12